MPLASTPLTAVAVFTADVYPPLAGTAVRAQDVQDGEQALLNRSEFLHAVAKGGAAVARSQFPSVASAWSVGTTGIWMTTVNTLARMYNEFTDINAGFDDTELRGGAIYVQPKSGHGGLPATMPKAKFLILDINTGGQSTIETFTDGSGDVTAYQAYHYIGGMFATPEPFDATKHRVFALLETEAGANALDELQVTGAVVIWHPDLMIA